MNSPDGQAQGGTVIMRAFNNARGVGEMTFLNGATHFQRRKSYLNAVLLSVVRNKMDHEVQKKSNN